MAKKVKTGKTKVTTSKVAAALDAKVKQVAAQSTGTVVDAGVSNSVSNSEAQPGVHTTDNVVVRTDSTGDGAE